MRFLDGLPARRAFAFLAVFVIAACGDKLSADTPDLAAESRPGLGVVSEDGLTATQRSRLNGAPLDELAFVPADVEGFVRIDLASLAARDAETAQALSFIFRAQQPAVAELLDRAGLTVGKELARVYFVVGPSARHQESLLIAVTGPFKAARLVEVLASQGGVAERLPARQGGALFTWKSPDVRRFGATDLGPEDKRPPLGPTSIAVADGLILLGTPALVARAARMPELPVGKQTRHADVRGNTRLARELLAVDVSAAIWGVGHSHPEEGWLPSIVPGVERVRFHGALVDRGTGTLALRAQFTSAAQAQAFAKDLEVLLRTAASMGRSSPLGKVFDDLRKSSRIAVDDRVVTATAAM